MKFFFYIIAVLYPVLIFCGLVIFKIPLRIISLGLLFFAFFLFLGATKSKKKTSLDKKDLPGNRFSLLQSLLLLAVGAFCLLTNNPFVLKLYPVFVNAVFLAAFGFTLFSPPSMVFRFALLADRIKRTQKIQGSLGEKFVAVYCRKVTIVWCLFFIVNGSVSAFTVFWLSEASWALYNGGISYILMGILFGIEFLVRRMINKTIPRAVPISAFTSDSREKDTILCYSGSYHNGHYKTWNDFLAGTKVLRNLIEKTGKKRWILHCNDYWHFLLCYTALLQSKKDVLLTANVSPLYLAEIAADCASDTALITDEKDILGLLDCSFYVPLVVESGKMETVEPDIPRINADETVIIMYTSGTTGEPKAVRQRLTEFENDNAFILLKWGDEFLKRKVCSTVSPHHIYGLLFSVMLPFTAGVPFRRERILYPETFSQFTDDSYLIITVPALLKRAVEGSVMPGSVKSYGLCSPWIFTSGGAVPPDIAAGVEHLFGFWPLEVYGSTETSGIAWRQSKNGPEWIPFDNTELRIHENGCLNIKSPYIKDPKGFTTGDLAELLPDGRFILKGRADSIVKIEEKRISLPEMENRIMQSGLVRDVAVIAFEDKRQYIAAAMVLNEKGKEKFVSSDKYPVNKYFRGYLQQFFENVFIPKRWRYVETLPRNAQGKLLKQELEDLFRSSPKETQFISLPQGIAGTLVEQTSERAIVDFSVSASCPYFDGHFPGFPVFPAVAQFELVCACTEQVFGVKLSVQSSRRIKFSNIIIPDSKLRLFLQFDKTVVLRFSLSSPDSSKTYAEGTIYCTIADSGNESR